MNVAFLFPGQGSQFPEMLAHLPKHACVEETLQEASAILGQDVCELDSESALHSNSAVQICLFVAGVASAKMLMAEGVSPQAVAGLSVGAYAAAVACNTLAFKDGLKLVHKRGELMEARFPSGFGMSALVGLNETQVKNLISKANVENEPVFQSNIIAPLQITISGSSSALERVELAALQIGARKAERLKVSVPSHCTLYQSTAESLLREFESVTVNKPSVPFMSNISARPLRSAAAIVEDLAKNIAFGVRWHEATSVLVELGCTVFLEMNPGNVLTNLAIESFPNIRAVALRDSSLAFAQKVSRPDDS